MLETIKVLPPMQAGYDGDTIVSKEKEYTIRKYAEQWPTRNQGHSTDKQ